MVTIASRLLGFSATILWQVASQLVASDALARTEPLRALMDSVLGISISIAAGYISLLYGGYSNRSWQKGDQMRITRSSGSGR
jgi:hypothetical protein